MAVIFVNYPLQVPSYPDSVLASAFYESMSRVVWAAALAWLVFACVHGYGGPVNWFLSLPGWQPLARLSYAIYIVHAPIQFVLLSQLRVAGYFSDTTAVSLWPIDFKMHLLVNICFLDCGLLGTIRRVTLRCRPLDARF